MLGVDCDCSIVWSETYDGEGSDNFFRGFYV